MKFNARKYAEENPIQSQLPVDHYKVVVEKVESKKSSTGFDMLTFKIRVHDSVSGSYVNALHWENLVVGYEGEQTQRIAKQTLTAIMLANGISSVDSIDELQKLLEAQPFTMTIAKAKSGRLFPVFRPLDFFVSACAVGTPQSHVQSMPPAPSIEDYIDDIPF